MMPSDGSYEGVEPFKAGVAMFILFALVAIGAGWSSANGFWPSVLAGLKTFVKCIIIYIACGIVTLIPLWYVNAKRISREIMNKYYNFITYILGCADDVMRYNYKITLSAEEKEEIKKCNGIRGGEIIPCLKEIFELYKGNNRFPSLNAKDNIELISSLIFLWPIHILVDVFGEFIAKIPEYATTLLKFPLNIISKIVSRNIPKGIKS